MRFSPTRMYIAEAGCLWPFRREVDPPREKPNAKMRRGSMIHEDIEASLLNLAHKPKTIEAARAKEWAIQRWGGRTLCVEQAIGIDPATGAAQAYDSRDAIPPDSVAVIVDIFGELADGSVSVYDYKTGSQFSTFSYEPQIRLNGYAVAALHGQDQIETGLAYLSSEGVTVKTWSLDEFDLAHQRQKLRVWAEQAPTAEPTPCAACKWCAARSICPAQMEKSA